MRILLSIGYHTKLILGQKINPEIISALNGVVSVKEINAWEKPKQYAPIPDEEITISIIPDNSIIKEGEA